MTELTAAALPSLAADVSVPTYDRSAVRSRIVHVGVGGFHRAHEAMYLDRLLEAGRGDWGLCGVGVLPFDAAMRDALAAQDRLYTLVTTAPDGSSAARVVGSIVDYLFVPDDPEAVVAKLADPDTAIVSLTITEGGYGIDDATGGYAPRDEPTLADLDGALPPRSVMGLLTEGLRRRRDADIPAFTVMSCDNIQGNGHVARASLLGFAERLDPELAAWIAQNVSFPTSMVDRITPVTTDETRASIAEEFGVDDRWPVRSESFAQWVLEDAFPLGRPAFDEVGVQLVQDVEPYELMKLRLLNASHQAMSYLGILSGAHYVHEVCTDELFVAFLQGYMHAEAIPTLRPVPGIDLDAYCDELIARFGSEAIRDTLARQVVDGSDRLPKFLLPVVREQLAAGGRIDHAALVLAGWSVFLEGRTESGEETPAVDSRLDELRAIVADDPAALLDYAPVFGDLGQDARLREAYLAARALLAERGARGAIAAVVDA
ncbi:mannitol dehydrogenase family protein [Microbacterium sp. NPDC089180]|uniref:Mannitol-1-phosphate 5-dehydrogenase n=1 Tax=Microbacterium galbum TaxID=3075994 RepID=A0ABU3T9K0_9MICO|nr:mannitol dehydrogenase family protein [Microbacterium sp. KSW4-17]MDU0368038.1 mannitol dehydrogenase family protein [Microbacterium sp. KSW4-17]